MAVHEVSMVRHAPRGAVPRGVPPGTRLVLAGDTYSLASKRGDGIVSAHPVLSLLRIRTSDTGVRALH